MNLQYSNNRLFERFAVHFSVKFQGDESPGSMSLDDISAQGAKLLSKERFYVHDYVSLEVILPNLEESLVLHGKVIWMSTVEANTLWKVGLHFEGVNLKVLQYLYTKQKTVSGQRI